METSLLISKVLQCWNPDRNKMSPCQMHMVIRRHTGKVGYPDAHLFIQAGNQRAAFSLSFLRLSWREMAAADPWTRGKRGPCACSKSCS